MYSRIFEEGLSAKAQIILYLSAVIDTDLEVISQIYGYYKEFTLNSEREFQMTMYRGEKHPIVKSSEDAQARKWDDDDDDDDENPFEYFFVTSSIIARVGFHIHYHPSTDPIENTTHRYSGLFGEEQGVPWSCPCSECDYHLDNFKKGNELDKQISHRFWIDEDLRNMNDYVYTRIRNGCKQCKDESNLCDYCCKGVFTKKSCGKRSFLKYKKGSRKLKQPEDERYKCILHNGKVLNDVKITHKSMPKRK